MCQDHPFHTIYQILALRNSSFGLEKQSMTPRMEAAGNILNKLGSFPEISRIVREMEKLCAAYNELAYLDHSKNDADIKNPVKLISRGMQLLNSSFSSVVVSTINIPVNPEGNYEDMPRIHKFQNKFTLVGGINAPKRVECLGSDGKTYLQLVKGNDDLRQDAVLQQIFENVSALLRKHLESRKRDLSIRNYRVVPLSARSGVLEWISNTIPVGEYLLYAHKKYNPKDMDVIKARSLMLAEGKRKGWTKKSKLDLYVEVFFFSNLDYQKYSAFFKIFFLNFLFGSK
jgi:ataxia telangiectasia mutated family protein